MIPACTGLPPGELMRRITPWVFLFLNAFWRDSVMRSALASPFGSITPTTSTSAVCLPEVKPSSPRQSSAINRKRVRYAKPSSLKNTPQRRERRCSLSVANASFSITSRSQLPSAIRMVLQENPAVPLLDGDRNQAALEARPAQTSSGVRLIGRSVRRAYQNQAEDIKKLARLPVPLHRHVGAAVEVGVHAPLAADRERRLAFALHFHLEAHPVARVDQVAA